MSSRRRRWLSKQIAARPRRRSEISSQQPFRPRRPAGFEVRAQSDRPRRRTPPARCAELARWRPGGGKADRSRSMRLLWPTR